MLRVTHEPYKETGQDHIVTSITKDAVLGHRSHRDVIDRLRRTIDNVLGPLLDGPSRPYALLDFPDYGNVGDSAIWLGEITWLQAKFGMRPSYVCRLDADWNKLRSSAGDGPILLNGGGNFGDIWPHQQRFREAVLERFPGRRVIQLPQSIHYSDPVQVGRTARAISRHGAFTLLVRDVESYELARKSFDCEVRLCPDMAFVLGAARRPVPATNDVLMLLRSDKERADLNPDHGELPAGWIVDDWLVDEPNTNLNAKLDWAKQCLFEPALIGGAARQAFYFERLARRRVARGLRLLSTARVIVSDRLHVHILSTLLGIPHVTLDNVYGKIGRFSTAFDTGWAGVRRSKDLGEAKKIAVQLLATG